MRTPLSVLVPTFNEEENIEACLRSAIDIADELVVVDSFSTDRTVDIARSLGATVLQREYRYSTSQKNWALPHLAHDWVLIVDADERVTPRLRAEIRRLLEGEPARSGYWIRRDTYYFGRRVRCLSFDTVLRLFDRRRGRYEDKLVHGEVQLEGEAGRLSGALEHHTARSFAQLMPKVERYSTWAAQEAWLRGKRSSWWRIASYPLGHFLKFFVVKGGCLDGTRGLVAASNDAYRTFLKYAKLWELEWRASQGLALGIPPTDEARRPRG